MTLFKKALVAAAFVTVILGFKGFVSFHVKDNLEAIHEGLWAMLTDHNAIVVEIDNSRVHVNGGPA
jgi:hypothetical protein